jgi:outer membrane lipoprotein-sorting protein
MPRGDWQVTQVRRLGTRARWAVPAGAVAAAGVIIVAATVASASEPSLPSISAAQLLTRVQQAAARPAGPMTATVQETTNLGIPALSQIGAITGQSGQLNALGGTTTLSFWYLNPTHVRVAVPVQAGESDVRVDGTTVWLWDSKTQTATRVLLPAPVRSALRSQSTASATASASHVMVQTPLTTARQVLAALGPSTRVQVAGTVQVAGRAAYQLAISPKGSGSLISRVLIAIDASKYVPLQVQVFARGSSAPAVQVGYTALSFGPPAASNFSFTPPPGAKVKNIKVPAKAPGGLLGGLGLTRLGLLGPALTGPLGAGLGPSGASAQIVITPNGQVANPHGRAGLPKAVLVHRGALAKAMLLPKAGLLPKAALPKAELRRLRAQFLAHLATNLTKAQRAAAFKAFSAAIAGRGQAKAGGFASTKIMRARLSPLTRAELAKGAAAAPRVLGQGWTQVLVTPPSPQVAAAVQGLLALHQRPGPIQSSPSTSSASGPGAYSSTLQVSPAGPAGPDLAVLQALLKASTPVKGSWGSGRLLRSSLLTILVTSNGRVLAGAVTPSVLYADAATLAK